MGVTRVQRCEWHDLRKRLGEQGRNCHVIADWEITRIVAESRYVNYRCTWHVPEAKPRIGSLEVRPLTAADHRRITANTCSETVIGTAYHGAHVGDPS